MKTKLDITEPASQRDGIIWLSFPAIVIACILLLPFIRKAYGIDDPYFLLMAEQTRRNPLHPLNFNLCWFDPPRCGPAYTLAPGAALMGYVLLPFIGFAAREWVIHLVQLSILIGGLLATVSLARRLGLTDSEARATGLILVAFPPLLALTNSVTPDTLSMSLGVFGIERFIAWLEKENFANAAAAAIALGLAPFARLHAIGMIGVGVLAAFLFTRSKTAAPLLRWLLPLGAGVLLFVVLTRLTHESGVAGPLPPEFNMRMKNVPNNIRSYFWYYLVCFPIVVFWLIRVRRYALWLILWPVAVFSLLRLLTDLSTQRSALWAVSALSMLSIGHLLWQATQKRSWEWMLLFWLLFPVIVAPYLHLPPKIAMIYAPAAAILSVTLLRGESSKFRNAVLSGVIVAGAIASVLVLDADERFVNLARQASADLVAANVRRGERIWFSGQWGMYWYALHDGARLFVPGGPAPERGDLLVTESFEQSSTVLAKFPQRQLAAGLTFSWKGGRVLSHRHGAGLYSNLWGPLPWSWGSGEVDRFELWRIY